jgi:hypothetical protein
MYLREVEKKLGWLNSSACPYAFPTMPSGRGVCELTRMLNSECGGEDFQRNSRELNIRSGGPAWDRADALRSLDVVLAHVGVQICDGDLDLMMHFNAVCELYRALQELDDGVVVPMLRPTRLNHRPAASRTQVIIKHLLVNCYSALRTIGFSRDAAERDVVLLLNRPSATFEKARKALRGSGRVTKTTVYRWWRRFRHDTKWYSCLTPGRSRKDILEETEAILARVLGGDEAVLSQKSEVVPLFGTEWV